MSGRIGRSTPLAAKRLILPVVAAAVLSGGSVERADAQCSYEVTTIRGPSCGVFDPPVSGTGLNEHGHVVGYYQQCANPARHEAFLWTPQSGLTTLPRPVGVNSAQAADISDAGVIVGTYTVTNVGFRGFVYEDGGYTELAPAPPGLWSMAFAINNAGQIVGYRSIGAGVNPYNAFIWSASDGFIDLGLMDDVQTSATDINDQSEVVGWRGLPGATDEAFLWESGEVTFLGPIPGGFTSVAGGINNSGQIIVTGLLEENGDTLIRSFLWSGGRFTDLGVLPGFDRCTAVDINDTGQVIGVCDHSNNPNNDVPFIWQNGVMNLLADLILDGSGIQLLTTVRAINNSGQITGSASGVDGFRVAVILTPIDGPPGDVNGDCRTDVDDLIILVEAWGQAGSPADLNDDGVVNVLDLIDLLLNFGSSSAANT